MPLVERSDSVLVVVDAQPGFSGANDEAGRVAASSREVPAGSRVSRRHWVCQSW
jgi:hypothetical protein